MIKKLLFLVLVPITFMASAQSYQPFNYKIRYQFLNASQDTITSLTLDSSLIINDERILVFNPIFPDDHQLSPRGQVDSNNVFGKYMISKGNGDFLFVTQEKDTFLIKTKVALNSKWKFAKSKNIEATYLKITDTTVFGKEDSVMVIGLSDGNRIEISKTYGIVKSINFNSYFGRAAKNPLSITAIPEYSFGKFLSDPFVYYDFQPGDVFGYSTEVTNINSYRKIRKEIINRTIYGQDSIVYTIRRIIMRREGNALFHADGSIITQDEITETIKRVPKPVNEQRPFYYGLSDVYNNNESLHQNIALNWLSNQYSYNTNEPPYRAIIYKNPDATKYSMNFASVNNFETVLNITYQEGLGWTNFNYSDRRNGHVTKTDVLECYVKNGVKFGDCSHFDQILSTNSEDQKLELQVYPNPATDQTTLYFPGVLIADRPILIYNSIGVEVYYKKIPNDATSHTITTSNFAPGLYFIKFHGVNALTKTFVKQ